MSEQPKVVSGVCVANSQAERYYRSAGIAERLETISELEEQSVTKINVIA
ncbi:MAG: hypothetical protein ISR78_08565 [Spirochaetia bacterium]|nr:hypothetical protein [Spirochaetia bacterium]